jgi:hypothetical protein
MFAGFILLKVPCRPSLSENRAKKENEEEISDFGIRP